MPDQPGTNGTRWRIEALEARASAWERRQEQLEANYNQLRFENGILKEKLETNTNETRSLRRGFYTFAFTVAAGAIGTGLAVVALVGQ